MMAIASASTLSRQGVAAAFSLAEATIQPGTSGPPLHSHRELLDSFYVLEGTLTVQVGDEEVEAGPGAYVCAPPGVVHTYANRSASPVRFLNLNTPGAAHADSPDHRPAGPACGRPGRPRWAPYLSRKDLEL